MNVLQVIKGRERWSMIADNIWDMIIGKAGKLPGNLIHKLLKLQKIKEKNFIQESLKIIILMNLIYLEKKWKKMAGIQVKMMKNYLNLQCTNVNIVIINQVLQKQRFKEELQKIREEANRPKGTGHVKADPTKKDIASPYMGRIFYNLNYFIEEQAVELGNVVKKGQRICYIENNYTYDEIVSDYDGEVDEIFFQHGDMVSKGDVIVRLK